MSVKETAGQDFANLLDVLMQIQIPEEERED